MFSLPHFCSSVSHQLSEATISRVAAEKAFVCLPEELTEVVVRRYVDFVHPQLPILDIDELLSVLDAPHDLKRTISVLLWQALAAAVAPFFTAPELGLAGLVSVDTATSSFIRRAKVLIDADYEPCQKTELQALLLICWRLSINPEASGIHNAFMERALHHSKSIEPRVMRRPPAGNCPTAGDARLWWSFYILQATPTFGSIQSSMKLRHPSSITPVTLDDFEMGWLSLPRARAWYVQLGQREALTQHLQMASCFCQKTQLCAKLQGVSHVLNQYPNKTKRPSRWCPTFSVNEILPVSPMFWMAVDFDGELEGIQKRAVIANQEEDGFATLVHLIDLILLYRVIIFSLLLSEKVTLCLESDTRRPPPELLVAEDLIYNKLERTCVAILHILTFMYGRRIPLLADNINPHILKNLDILASKMEAESGKCPKQSLIYRELSTLLRLGIRKCCDGISLQSDTIPLEPDVSLTPEIIMEYTGTCRLVTETS